MLEGIGIGAGAGLVALVGVVIGFLVVLRRSQDQTNSATSRNVELAKRLDTALEDITELEKNVAIYQTNESELKRELDSKNTKLRELNARVESIGKMRADLANVLMANPGAVTAVVSAAFERLREEVSRAQALASAATGDSSGGEAGRVHAPTDDGTPR